MIGDRPIWLEVDGGVTAGRPRRCAARPAPTRFVAGSAVFRGGPAAYAANIAALRAACG